MPVVEGHSEVESLPILLRRLGAYHVGKPFRVKRNRIVRAGELESVIRSIPTLRPNVSSILIVLDADDDAACELGPSLLARCEASSTLPCGVVVAKREFEAWFLGAIESLRGKRGILPTAVFEGDPEEPRNAKGRLDALMGGRYLEVEDQPALCDAMDLQRARHRSPSFDKLVREVERLAHL